MRQWQLLPGLFAGLPRPGAIPLGPKALDVGAPGAMLAGPNALGVAAPGAIPGLRVPKPAPGPAEG